MDYDKLAKEFGGSAFEPAADLDKLAQDFGGTSIKLPTPEEQEALNTAYDPMTGLQVSNVPPAVTPAKAEKPAELQPVADTAKLLGAGMATMAGIPEGIQSAAQAKAAEMFAPMDIINQLANPQKVFNKIVSGELFIPRGIKKNLESRGMELPKPMDVPQKDLIDYNRVSAEVDKTLSKGKIPQFKDLALWGEKTSQGLMEDLSPQMKDAIAMSTPTGDIVKALDNWDLSGLSAGKDPSALGYYGQGVKVFGSALPMIVSSVLTKSAAPATALGFGQAASEGVSDARDYIGKMSYEELSKKSEYFRNLIALGYKPDLAKQMTEDKAGNTAAEYQGIVGALGGNFTGNLLAGKFANKIPAIKSKIARGFGTVLASSGEEGFQEYMEGIATDVGIDKTVVRQMGAESFANFLLGALGGFGPGTVAGVREAAAPSEKPPAPPTAAAPTEPAAPAPQVAPEPVTAKKPEEIQAPTSLTPVIDETQVPPPASQAPAPIVGKAIGEEEIEPEPTVIPQVPAPAAPAAPTQAEINQQRQAEQRAAKERKITPQEFDQDEIATAAQIVRSGNGIEYTEAAHPLLKKLEKAGLIDLKGKGKVFISKEALAAGIKGGSGFSPFAGSSDMAKLESFLKPEKAPKAGEVVEPTKPGNVSESEMDQVHYAQRNGKGLDVIPEDMYMSKQNPGIQYGTAFQHAAEHIGDLVHRLSSTDKNQGGGHKYGIGAALKKASSKYYFNDMLAQVDRNYYYYQEKQGYTGSIEEFRNEFKNAAAKYAQAYKNIPTHTEFQELGKQAAIALGELRFSDAQSILDKLVKKLESPTVEEDYFKKKSAEEAVAAKREVKVTANKVFTEDAAEKARELLKSKLNTLYSGIDPEILQAGIIISGYHVEKGARTFAAYSKAMIADLGDVVKPYLKSWYMALKFDPRSEEFKNDMDSADAVEKFTFEETEKPDLLDPDQKFGAAEQISKAFLDGKKFKDIREARQFLQNIIGRVINPGTALAKEADEAIEVGVVLAAQQIVKEGKSPSETYDRLVELYNQQPGLNVRSSESIAQQAYSTPAPLAYIASQLAGINNKTTVMEPTAGNGMLLIDADPKKVRANELNPTRYEMLKRVLPGADISNTDALKYSLELSDVVIANPPFGAIGEEVQVNGKATREIDHAIVYKSLGRMPVTGRAVLLVGGVRANTEEGRREGYRSAQKRNFYFNLYKEYNVVDHFTIEGDLYGKQGAKYPVDVIVIDGKGEAQRDLPAAELPKVYSSYEQLKEKLDEASRMVSGRNGRAAGVAPGEVTAGEREPQPVGAGVVGPSGGVSREGKEPTAVSKPSVPAAERPAARPSEPTGAKPSEPKPGPFDKLERGNRGQEPVSIESAGAERVAGENVRPGEPTDMGGLGVGAGARVESRLADRRGLEAETETQVTYKPHSEASSVGTLVPVAMRDAIEQSLNLVEEQVGNLDEYVAKALNMDVEKLRGNFSAEQVDALALAIANASKGKGFIIGDQTGIGKGRVVAGMIKYALANGKIPIFVTEKPNLYSDMIRDLDDIGMAKELGLESPKSKIFITNSSESIPYQLVRTGPNGEPTENNYTLKPPKTGKALDAMMKEMANANSLGDYKVIFTTYSQLQTQKEKLPERARFIQHFGAGNYMIFDESHNAGGAGAEAKKEGAADRATFVRGLVRKAYGTFFSSATYAKRPDVMDLYSSTNMSLAVDKPSMLGEAIKHGGVPMQQIVATMLTKDGQYIRRERTFKGIEYNTVDTKVDKQTAENMASAMRDILAFSRKKDIVIKQMQKELDREAKVVSEFGGEKTSIQGANFGAIMHNLIDQMLLSLKAQDSIRHAIERLKAGNKVVMTVSNTMGSFLQSYAEDMDIKVGDPVNLSFSDLYIRYLEKQRMIRVKGPEGIKLVRLTDEDLGPSMVAEYEAIKQKIMDSGFGSAPISPIDYIHNELRKAGYKTEEITGRTITLNYAGGKPVLQTRTANIKQRVNAVRLFNSGETDVIILNQAGSTGLSLHASEKVKDKNKRHMIIIQPEKNIDVHVQMLGRVNRTGQVTVPAYSQMMADIPAEMRPAAVLLKKMASLNANTTASRKSAVTAEGVVDFMNDYGGQVAIEYLKDNPEIYEALGGERLMNLDSSEEPNEGDIRRLTGYIPILPISQQEEVYADLIDRYNELIAREDAMGTNKLEAKAVDLEAETISREPVTEDKGQASIFSQPAYMERVDVKRTVKPFSKAEVEEMVAKHLDGKRAGDVAMEHIQDLKTRFDKFLEDARSRAIERGDDPVKVQSLVSNLGLGYTNVRTILQNYRIGNSVTIKDPSNVFTFGVITNITNAKRTANPAAGSDWKLHIALANGESKSLDINFSQIPGKFEIKTTTEVDWLNPETGRGEWTQIKDIFDKGATVRREKRWIITGNILGGFAKYPGQIITYTKKDGTLGQGVLLSRQFDYEKAKKEAPVYLKSADDVMKYMNNIGGEIGTDDNMLRISKRGNRYVFMTPRSKRQGGKYFDNAGLKDIIGSFYSRGTDMIADTYREDDLRKAVDYILNEMDEKLVVKLGTEQARELFAPKLSQEEINQQRQADKAKEGGQFYNNFSQDVGEEDIVKNIPVVREDIIKEYAALRQSGRRLLQQVAKYGSTVPLQKQLNEMLAQEQNLKSEIQATKPINNTAEAFMARATKALADGQMTPDVEAFIRTMFTKYPGILEGLKLSVKENKTTGKVRGNFDPFKRLVTLYRHTAGVTEASTARHEIMHSLEQMMTPGAREDVITEWARSLEQAMRENVDKRSREYFDAVLVFLANPTKETSDAASKIMPSYEFYQYLSPSEYWAVNAEKLMGMKLGTAWQRFVLGVKKIIEGLKRFFGFNNKYAVHQALNAILKGEHIRSSKEMLMDYIADGKYKVDLLNNIQDEQDLIDKYDVPEVPGHDPRSMKDMMVGSWEKVKDFMESSNKRNKIQNEYTKLMSDAWEGATWARIKNVWFGAGLDEADLRKYKGKIRTENGMMIAAVAVRNSIHSGYIATRVILDGALEYSQKYGQFIAVKRDKSMANVVKGQYALRKRLGRKLADQIINGFFAAKRLRAIQNDYLTTLGEVEGLKDALQSETDAEKRLLIAAELEEAQARLQNIRVAYEKAPAYLCILDEKKPYITKDGNRIPNVKYGQDGLPVLNDEAMDDFIGMAKNHPELDEMMANWTAVNHNMLDNMAFSGRISKKEAERLKAIKDFSPWYRLMDEEEPLYDSGRIPGNTSGIKYFEPGRTERDLDNVVDSMLHNVSIMTRSTIRNYANNRVVMEYGERRMVKDPKTGEMKPGRLRVYPTTGRDETGVRLPIFVNGRRVVVKIPDAQIAEAVLGMAMPAASYPFKNFFSTTSQLFRRSITLSGYFQVKQLIYDAPTAAWVSGVKNPFAVWGGTFSNFLRAYSGITKEGMPMDDATIQVLQSAGIGGYQSFHRTEKKERAIELGLIDHKNMAKFLKAIDRVGDASDYAQRMAVYKQVLKETGDPAQAMLQSSDIVDWQKHGSGTIANFLRSSVTFIQAWATQLDALAQASMGKGFKGKTRKEAAQQFYTTGMMLAGVCLLYTMAAAGDDDYWELDDMTRARNFYIPGSKKLLGHHVLIPMHSSAAYFFKVWPEMVYTTIVSQGTKNKVDAHRLYKVLAKSALDMIGGPEPVPTGIKSTVEIAFNHNFFTGSTVTPRSLEGLAAAEQYNAATSELGKFISSLTGTKETRLLNPIEADHIVRGTFGSMGAVGMWFSNQVFGGKERPTPQMKDNPFYGGIIAADVQRKNEDLFYDLKDRTEKEYNTFKKLHERGRHEEAKQYFQENKGKIQAHAYVLQAEAQIKGINKEIRRIGETHAPKLTPDLKRERINKLTEIKNNALRSSIAMRERAGL